MKKFIGLTKRNLLIFFKDKQSIVFSLLTSIIVFVLYLLFLKGTFVDVFHNVLDNVSVLKDLVTEEEIEMCVNFILLVGILGSAMITVPYNCLTTVIKDRENRIDYDILATPISRGEIILSYFVASLVSAILMTSVILMVGLGILSFQGDIHMGVKDICQAFGVVALGCLSSTAIFMIVVLFFKSSSASGAFFGMLSAACGFVIGAYIPISQFSESVQTFCNLFPASQITILLRNVLLNGTLESINDSIQGYDQGLFVEHIKGVFSFEANIFGNMWEIKQMLIYVSIVMVVSIGIMVVAYSKTYKKK